MTATSAAFWPVVGRNHVVVGADRRDHVLERRRAAAARSRASTAAASASLSVRIAVGVR